MMRSFKEFLNVDEIRNHFPILNQKINGKRYAFLDSAASSQMPEEVIDYIANYHRTTHANVHRGLYKASIQAKIGRAHV